VEGDMVAESVPVIETNKLADIPVRVNLD
jgi:hypothetical protein